MQSFGFFGFGGIELLAILFFFIGSYSLGYLLLRTGWPKIRILEENYRIGWSIVFGAAFSIIWVSVSVIFGLQKIFPIIFTISLLVVLAVLSARRKLFSARIGTVSIPKKKAMEHIIAEKSMMQLVSDRQFILNKSITKEQLEKIKETLEKKGSESA